MGDLICNDLDTTGATSITVDFWYRLQNTQSDDLELYFYNGNTYNKIISLGGNKKKHGYIALIQSLIHNILYRTLKSDSTASL